MSGVRGDSCILREAVTTQTLSFAQWVEKFTVGGSRMEGREVKGQGSKGRNFYEKSHENHKNGRLLH
jgi:hypothetical protein